MKAFKIFLIVVFLVVYLCSGVVSALTLTSDQASVRALVSDVEPQAGDTITVYFYFSNNYTNSLNLTFVGLHFDWMPQETFYGFNLSSTPLTVESGTDHFFEQPINVNVPTDVNGIHTYTVGVEGNVGASSDTFSLDSTPGEILVSGNGQTPVPTNTNSGGGQQSNILLYSAVVVVLVVVALLIVVMLTRKKRKYPEKATEPSESPKQEETPSEQDFSI